MRLGATSALPEGIEFVVGQTTFEQALAAIGTRPDSLQYLAEGERLACWYGYRLFLSASDYEPEADLDFFLQLRFDGQGFLTASNRLAPGPLPPVEGCTCRWPGVRGDTR